MSRGRRIKITVSLIKSGKKNVCYILMVGIPKCISTASYQAMSGCIKGLKQTLGLLKLEYFLQRQLHLGQMMKNPISFDCTDVSKWNWKRSLSSKYTIKQLFSSFPQKGLPWSGMIRCFDKIIVNTRPRAFNRKSNHRLGLHEHCVKVFFRQACFQGQEWTFPLQLQCRCPR